MKLTENQSLFIHLVRGLSALAVMMGHSLDLLSGPPALSWYRLQSVAVVVFFVLSGFLICMNATKPGNTLGNYLIDRFARIFVAFVPALLLTLALDWMTGRISDRLSISAFLANMLMLQGIPFDRLVSWGPFFQPFGSNSPLWTVAVEWWLYVAFGLVIFSTRIRGLLIPLMAVLAIPAIGTVALYSLRENLSTTWIIAAMVAVPLLHLNAMHARQFAWAALALSLAALVYRTAQLSLGAKFLPYDVQLMLAISFSVLSAIAALKSVTRPIFPAKAAIKWLGDISYSLYLIHYPIMLAMVVYFPPKWSVLEYVLFNAIGLTAATIFFHLFDDRHKDVADLIKAALRRSQRGPAIPQG